ncbi:MAG: TetR/AcrR family transcriptional regulator [Solirubrobacterales bacterium]
MTARAVAPIELPSPPEPRPQDDPITLAVIAEIVEKGYEGTTVEDVARRAGIPTEEFDNRFEGLEHCALDSFERNIANFERRVGIAFNSHSDWPSALRAAAYATADWMQENPLVVSFGMVDVLKLPGEMGRVRREETFAFCSRMIDRGRQVAPDPEAIPDAAPTFAIGAITQLLTHRLQEGAEVEPREVIPEMMSRVVSIYLGDEAGETEWTAEPPPPTTPER